MPISPEKEIGYQIIGARINESSLYIVKVKIFLCSIHREIP